MAKFNFSNFKESLNGLTKRAKKHQGQAFRFFLAITRKTLCASDQSLGWRIANTVYWTAHFLCSLCHRWW